MIACDIVLLPPPEVMDKAIDINKRLIEGGRDEIVLDRETRLPHITLAMGCMEEKDLKDVDLILKSIAEDMAPVPLKTIPLNNEPASIRIEKGRDIELLHEIVMIRMSRFFSHNATKEMIFNPQNEEIAQLTLDYIREFPIKSSFENYTPHITIGLGEVDIQVESIDFVCNELALCHLGNYCTCRKILLSHNL